ncbi:hypothetical protein CR513_54005, partial [Mucuna pruriens]
MRSKVERSHQGRSRLRKHPFIDGIIDTPLPTGWKNLTLDKYDGTTNLDEHIVAYEDDELLRSFMERFAVAIKIKDLNLEVALHSMIMALKPRLFSNSICKKPYVSMNKLRERADGYIQMEKIA